MSYGQEVPRHRVYCTVAGCKHNDNSETCVLDGIHVEDDEKGNKHTPDATKCGNYEPRG